MNLRAVFLCCLLLIIVTSCAINDTNSNTTAQEINTTAVEQLVAEAVKDTSPYIHARRSPGQDPKEARQKLVGWIRFNFNKAFIAKSIGENDVALYHYLIARHALRDSTLSEANDENGNPAILPPNQEPNHVFSEKAYWRDRVDEESKNMFDKGSVPEGDLIDLFGIDSENGPVKRVDQKS